MDDTENDYHPSNDLERAMVEARAGRLSTQDFVRVMLSSEVHVLSGSDPGEDGREFAPLFYPHPTTGDRMLAMYSSPARIGEDAKRAPFMLTVECGDFLRRLPDDIGMVLNPGDTVGFELMPNVVASIASQIKQRKQN